MSLKNYLALFFCVSMVTFAIPSSVIAKPDGVIGISKIVAHPALDAVEQGIQQRLEQLAVTA